VKVCEDTEQKKWQLGKTEFVYLLCEKEAKLSAREVDDCKGNLSCNHVATPSITSQGKAGAHLRQSSFI